MDLLGTNRMLGRLTASQIASASLASFFCDFRLGLTNLMPQSSEHACPAAGKSLHIGWLSIGDEEVLDTFDESV